MVPSPLWVSALHLLSISAILLVLSLITPSSCPVASSPAKSTGRPVTSASQPHPPLPPWSSRWLLCYCCSLSCVAHPLVLLLPLPPLMIYCPIPLLYYRLSPYHNSGQEKTTQRNSLLAELQHQGGSTRGYLAVEQSEKRCLRHR